MDCQKLFTGVLTNPLAYGIVPGRGLQGSPFYNRGPTTWSVVFGGNGVATTVSRSDHTHPVAWTDPVIKNHSTGLYYKLYAESQTDQDGNINVTPVAILCNPPEGAD
jgi:hypothetical protein